MMQRYRFAKILAVNTAFYWFSLIETLLTPKSRPRSWTVPNSELGFMKQPRRMCAIRPFSPLIRNWCLYSADPVPTRSTFIQGAPWNTWFFDIDSRQNSIILFSSRSWFFFFQHLSRLFYSLRNSRRRNRYSRSSNSLVTLCRPSSRICQITMVFPSW